jgi:hypothetical protein
MTKLESVVAASTPLLERALYLEVERRYATELQLRGTVCGLATAALQLYANERHGLVLDRRRVTPPKAPRGMNSRKLEHVGLFDDNTMIDPTYGQFFSYVGLSQTAAQYQPGLVTLFPKDKVAVIPKREARTFARSMAAHMHAVEPEVLRRTPSGYVAYPPENSLRGSSLAKKEEVLEDIWNPNGYRDFPLDSQSTSFQNRALRLAARMHELER